MILECDATKAKTDLSWIPQIPLKQTLKDMIDYFENQPELLDIEAH
jgi:nucleoside-diphosphate-sugar epimerase